MSQLCLNVIMHLLVGCVIGLSQLPMRKPPRFRICRNFWNHRCPSQLKFLYSSHVLEIMKTLLSVLLFTFCASACAETPQMEFVTQVLEPTGGKILRPKDWFYAEGHRGPAYRWTLSREDTSGSKPYTTGVRIQAFVDVKQGTGKTAKQFILDFLATKKNEATIVNSCNESNQGLFTHTCLETEEGPYHILYSLFWGRSGTDIAVVSISGTTKELWATYSPIFDKMSAFGLIDMGRLVK